MFYFWVPVMYHLDVLWSMTWWRASVLSRSDPGFSTLQAQSAVAMWKRVPKYWTARTWGRSYRCTGRTATCWSTVAVMSSQGKALTCWSSITPTHCGETKRFTIEFITVPENPVSRFLRMFGLRGKTKKLLLLRTINYFLILTLLRK